MTGWERPLQTGNSLCEDPGARRGVVSSGNERDLVTVLGKLLVTEHTSRLIVIMNFGSPPDTTAGETGCHCKEMVLGGAEAVEGPVLKTL